MGKLRTIQHPGIEIQEIDKSGATEQVGGCTSLVMGFFPQGEAGVAVQPTTLSSVKSYFGTPETEAERYAYYACKTVFDNGGKLIAARIPYDNNSQYITPAVKYTIEEWASENVTTYPSNADYKTARPITSSTPSTADISFDDLYYSPSRQSPILTTVSKLTDEGSETVTAIKAYYSDGNWHYPECTTDNFMEVTATGIKDFTASKFTEANKEKITVTHHTYTETPTGSVVIKNGAFKEVFISKTLIDGAYKVDNDTFKTEHLEIKNNGGVTESSYPSVKEIENPCGEGWISVLDVLNSDGTSGEPQNGATQEYSYDDRNVGNKDFEDIYQFISPYKNPLEVAQHQSQNYKWVRLRKHKTSADSAKNGSLLLSRVIGCEPQEVPSALSKIEHLVAIVPDNDNNGYIPLEEYLDYRDGAKEVAENSIVITSITENKFGKDIFNNTRDDIADASEVLGIVPVIMSGFQALPKQSRIELPETLSNSRIFNALETIVRGRSIDNDPSPEADQVVVKNIDLNNDGYATNIANIEAYNPFEATYSNTALATVPAIDLNSNYKPNGAKVNYITIAVCQLSLSKANDNKVGLTILESFTGSLDKNAKDDNNKSIFIDNIVNNDETGSTYIRCYSNYKSGITGSETRKLTEKRVVNPSSSENTATIVVPASLGTDNWWKERKKMFTMGFTEEQTKKYISYATIVGTLENVYDMLSNVDELDIDLVVDAGLSTIANSIKNFCDVNPEATKNVYDLTYYPINSVNDIAGWKNMCAKYITFCQTTRKDCIALIDAPRSLALKNNAKLIDCKKAGGKKHSIDFDILPKFNYLGGLNSSYGAGFCTWIMAVDDYSSKSFWMPPSIAAEGNVIYTDYNSNYWMPPAGQSRGNILWAIDLAFNPNAAQQDSIYSKNWNYAINMSGNIMTWGQKTFLTSISSFNRINVRRLFCRLERLVRKNSKWVIFELNNEKTRNLYLDRIDPIFNNVKSMGGIFDYQIICDNRNNPPSVRANNEFRAAFLIKPEYAAEFIILTFFNMNQDMDFSEVYSEL